VTIKEKWVAPELTTDSLERYDEVELEDVRPDWASSTCC